MMKNKALARRVLCSVLAIGLGGFVLPLAAQANSGLSEETIIVNGNTYYAGSKGAADNVVHIDSDLPEKDAGVIGGYAEEGAVTDNSVSMSGGTVDKNVYGGIVLGLTIQGTNLAGNNSVSISGGIVNGNVYGGSVGYGDATGNSVSMSGGTVKGGVYGGYAFSDVATGNRVSMSGGIVEAANSANIGVRGGSVVYGDATGNSVSMSGSTVKGGVYGGYAAEGTATGNSVSMSGGTVTGAVYGGIVLGLTIQGTNLAGNNSVSISGGIVNGNVYGGSVGYGDATGNSITLSGTADVSRAALYGGYLGSGNGTVENNKLIIDGWSGKVQSLNAFNGDEGGIEVKALAGGLDLAVGQRTAFVMSQAEIDSTDNKLITTQATEMQAGVALTVSGEIGISDDNQNIYINPTSVRASDQTAITTESRAAAAAFVNQGAAVVADSINSLQGAEAGISTFATVSGNNSKYDTGSYVDINGWNGIVGVAKTKDLNAGKFSYGAFFENGGGNYNTYNDFNGTSFRGDGNAVYNGGGLLMRYEQENGVYTEASLRAGTAKNEVDNVLEFAGRRYGYKTENAYYGAHIGIGKIFKLDNGKAWDVYGKYFHTHHEGDSVNIANDVFDFDSVDSDKLRIGARFSEQQSEKLSSYYGLAWEYEFSGDAGGTAAGHAMYTPSLEGSTVIGEIGFRYTPGKESPWYFDANVRGYVGMQEGISGSVQAVYSF